MKWYTGSIDLSECVIDKTLACKLDIRVWFRRDFFFLIWDNQTTNIWPVFKPNFLGKDWHIPLINVEGVRKAATAGNHRVDHTATLDWLYNRPSLSSYSWTLSHQSADKHWLWFCRFATELIVMLDFDLYITSWIRDNWIRDILRRNYLLHDTIEGQMTEVKGVERRRTQLLNDLRNRRRYWELNEEAEDRKRWKQQFIKRTEEEIKVWWKFSFQNDHLKLLRRNTS